MAEEKIFTIPLREAYDKPRTTRAKKATNIVRDFLKKHMKSENIKLGKSINEAIWKRGIQKPPRRVRIHAVKEGDIIYTELLGVEIKTASKEEIKKKEAKKEQKKEKIKEDRKERKKKTIQEEMQEEVKGKPKELPGEEIKEEPKAEEKK
ncbi:50S ribosomal protein L31e [Candidatus Micrarchaeota archaeon RBG_16_36_9]|nr:MAG: 50S ribosomal protein L31e [Candidatus Micrarchaeota archaeon RBG_16_36_9]